jgi:hypothetical protein
MLRKYEESCALRFQSSNKRVDFTETRGIAPKHNHFHNKSLYLLPNSPSLGWLSPFFHGYNHHPTGFAKALPTLLL